MEKCLTKSSAEPYCPNFEQKATEALREDLKLHRYDLSFIGADNKRIVEPGEFDVMIGGLKEEFTLK